MYTLFQTLWGAVISATLNRIYGVRDFVTPQTMFVFFFLRDTMPAEHVTAKNGIPDQTDGKWQNLYPISDFKCLKTVPFGAAHTYMAYIWEYPPPPPPPGFKGSH